MEPISIGTVLTYVATGLVSGLGGWMAFRRKLSRDGVEFAKDRVEVDVITLLTKQRDEALERQQSLNEKLQTVADEKNAYIEELRKFKVDFAKIQERLKLSDALVKRLSSTLDYTKAELDKIVKEQQKKRDE